MMKVRDLKPGMYHLDIEVDVAEVSAPRKVMLASGIKRDILEIKVKDETGTIALTLWDDKILQGLGRGDRLQVANGFVTSFHGEWRINVGKYGEIKRI